jgi:uncharacterized protein YfeS
VDFLEDEWELAPENAHENARRLLKAAFYWDLGDENSPFGNDTGYDVFESWRAWIRHSDEEEDFLEEVFDEWEVDRDLVESIPDAELADALEENEHDILTYDDAMVALAFAQLVLEGRTERAIAAAATRSLQRQVLPVVVDYRGWDDPDERRARCAAMIETLRQAI